MTDFDKELQLQLSDIKQDAHQKASVASRIALQGISAYADNTTAKGKASVSDKLMAIQDIYDMQEKTNIPFIMLGDLAKAIREKLDYYDGEVIQFGFKASNLVPEIKSLFLSWGFEETEYGYKYYFTPPTKWEIKIPIEIHLFKKHFTFFDNPDIGFFGVDEYRLPNPFDTYWKFRNEVV